MKQPDSPPDYLVIGHASKDIAPGQPEDFEPGGTALYSALTAQRLGLQAAMVTAYAQEDGAMLTLAREAGVWVHRVSSPQTTTFENIYDAQGRRTQVISAQASSISYADVPPAWLDAPIVHLGPVAQELPDSLPNAFTRCLLGITPQGWMRSWDREGKIRRSAWPVPPALTNLPSNILLALSFEDLGYNSELVKRYTELAPLTAITRGPDEAYIYDRGDVSAIPAYQTKVVDPTGAGDVFAAALFIWYKETTDLIASARFAHAAASCSIEGQGPSAIADRETVMRRCVKRELR